MIALDNPLFPIVTSLHCAASINCSQMWPPPSSSSPAGPTLIYLPHFRATLGPICGWALGSNPGDIKGDGNYRFQAFWPREFLGRRLWVSLGWLEVLLGRDATRRKRKMSTRSVSCKSSRSSMKPHNTFQIFIRFLLLKLIITIFFKVTRTRSRMHGPRLKT